MSEDSDAFREKLKKDMDVVKWDDMLHHHYVRDAVFLISPDLDFVDACALVANDEKSLIGGYVEQGKIKRPDGLEVEKWRKEKNFFHCIVVSPYVFIQIIE